MSRLRERWEIFWFEPASPVNLGFCRILFFGALFALYLPQDFVAWAEVSPIFWKPIGLFRCLHLPVLSAPLLAVIQALWKVTLGLSCIGLFTRLSTVTSFILGAYLLGLPYNFGLLSHSNAILVFVLGIMALSRCGDSWSVDQLLRTARLRGEPSVSHPLMSGEYTWPVRAVWLIMALIFFGAGFSKLRRSGIEWIVSDNMAILLIQSNYFLSGIEPLTAWGLHVAQYGWLCQLLAAATVVFEIGYPLALVSRRARWLIVPAMAFIQIGIRVLMGPSFEQFLICNLFWVRWNRVFVRVFADARRMRSFAASTFTRDS